MIPKRYQYKEYVLTLTESEAQKVLGKRSQGRGLYRILVFPKTTIVHLIPEWFMERY